MVAVSAADPSTGYGCLAATARKVAVTAIAKQGKLHNPKNQREGLQDSCTTTDVNGPEHQSTFTPACYPAHLSIRVAHDLTIGLK